VLEGTSVADVREVKLPDVITVDEIERLAVTVPLIAGSEPIVKEFPTVTEEMLTGTVLEIDAVTDPICAVPATNAGRVVSDTGCVAGKFEMLAVTLPICEVPAVTVTKPIRLLPIGRDSANPILPMLLPPAGRESKIVTGKERSRPKISPSPSCRPEMAGRELMVTVVLASVTPWVGTEARETGWV
jgi:hypothetical protein